MSARRTVTACVPAAALPASALAQSGGVGVADVSGVAMSLVIVVGLILGAAYILRRTPLGAVGRQSGPLKIVATLPLGPRERLVWVDAGGSELLLAVSPAGVFNVGNGAAGGAGGVERAPSPRPGLGTRRDGAGSGERA